MPTIALLFLLGTSLAWATYDAARKGLAERFPLVPLVFLLSLMQMPFFGVWLAIDGIPTLGGDYAWAAATSVTLNILANLLFIRSVALSPLSVTVPLLSLTPVFSALIALVVVAEHPTLRQWSGILIVVGGALMLNARTDDLRAPRALLTSLARERGAIYMAAVALLWSITSVADKVGAQNASPAFHALVQVGGMALGLGAWRVMRGQLGQTRSAREHPALLAGAVVAATLALGLQLLAFAYVLVSVVEATKRAVGMFAALAIGRFAFGETLGTVKVIAVIAMTAGTALILL